MYSTDTILSIAAVVVGTIALFAAVRFAARLITRRNERSADRALRAAHLKLAPTVGPLTFPGLVLFDSNRSGRFAIYVAAPSNSVGDRSENAIALIESDKHDMFPDPSPDGKQIVFARTESSHRKAKSEIWIADSDGSNQRMLVPDGTFPTFSSEGRTVYFERGRRLVMALDLSSLEVREIFPNGDPEFAGGAYQIAKPRVSANGRYVFFTSDRFGRWNAFYTDLQEKRTTHIRKGCEPAPYQRAQKVAWVNKRHYFSRSDIKQLDLRSNTVQPLPDDGAVEGHEYFPSLVDGDRYLLYSATENRNPAHDSANYQIYLRDLRSGQSVQVTQDRFTNRWPKLLRTVEPKSANSR